MWRAEDPQPDGGIKPGRGAWFSIRNASPPDVAEVPHELVHRACTCLGGEALREHLAKIPTAQDSRIEVAEPFEVGLLQPVAFGRDRAHAGAARPGGIPAIQLR